MNNKTLIAIALITIALITGLYVFLSSQYENTTPTPVVQSTSVVYKNTEYGFNFSLPLTWQGYSIIKDTWKSTGTESGPKLLIRNPKWTSSAPYEDLPILVFTISQWDSYAKEDFSVSAAPMQATELARNNMYVFALPPRWDFDYSLNFKEAEDIFAGNPLKAFNVEVSQGKININLVCEQALSYMSFTDGKSSEAFVSECKEGKHPEVIERYKVDMNLNGAQI